MAQHRVSLALPKVPIGNADAVFEVHRGGKMFGHLMISKGARGSD